MTITLQVLLPSSDAVPDRQGLGRKEEVDRREEDGGQRSGPPAVCLHWYWKLRAGDAAVVTGGQGEWEEPRT